jgi:hypothetical protein
MTVIAGERWAHDYRMIRRGNEKEAAEAALPPQAAVTFQREGDEARSAGEAAIAWTRVLIARIGKTAFFNFLENGSNRLAGTGRAQVVREPS